MASPGILLRCDEALRFIEGISDPVTRNLLNLTFTHMVKQVQLHKRHPQSDVDMLFLVTSLSAFFCEHDVLRRTLNGERVGAWFDDAAMGQENTVFSDSATLGDQFRPVALKD